MLIVVAIRKGIPYSLFDLIQKYTPFSENDQANFLDLFTKSLQRYRASPKHNFKSIHSEKIIEIAEVTKVGLDVFGNVEKLKLWLDTPSYALGKLKPIKLLKDSYGIFVQMKVFRLSMEKYATPLTGEGAAKFGGKSNFPIYWNHPMRSCSHYIQNPMNYAGLIQSEVNMDALFQQIK